MNLSSKKCSFASFLKIIQEKLSFFKGGHITTIRSGKLEILLNESATNESKLAVLIHEIAHLFLKHKLISSFILTRIHRLYSGDTYLDLNYFKGWRENVLKSSPHYTILQLTNI